MAEMEREFPVPQENFSVNYDYTDLVNSTAYVSFYPMDLQDGTSLKLSPNILYSAVGWVTIGGATVNDDYDILINKNVTLRGTALVNIPVIFYRSGAGSGSHNFNATVSIVKYDGSTETVIGTTSYALASGTLGSGATTQKVYAIEIDLTTTTITAGEYLRVSIDVAAQPAGTWCYYGRDPLNRTTLSGPAITSGAWTISQSKIDIPFRIIN